MPRSGLSAGAPDSGVLPGSVETGVRVGSSSIGCLLSFARILTREAGPVFVVPVPVRYASLIVIIMIIIIMIVIIGKYGLRP